MNLNFKFNDPFYINLTNLQYKFCKVKLFNFYLFKYQLLQILLLKLSIYWKPF